MTRYVGLPSSKTNLMAEVFPAYIIPAFISWWSIIFNYQLL